MAALIHEARERETQKKTILIVPPSAVIRIDETLNDKSAKAGTREAKPTSYTKPRK
jgi:hypothetical protein